MEQVATRKTDCVGALHPISALTSDIYPSATEFKDNRGNEHLKMHFNVEGPRNRGMANIHLIKHAGRSEHEYKYFFLDVSGHQRIYLENADNAAQQGSAKSKTTLFGIRWR